MSFARATILLVLLLPLQTSVVAHARPATGSEIRGVWAHPATFSSDSATAVSAIRTTLDAYTGVGINTVMILVKSTSGRVYYRSDICEGDPSYRWDFFAVFLREAKARGIAVHPWFCVFTEGAMPGRVREHPEWLIRGRKSEFLPVVNPAHPGARRYEISLIQELVSRYAVDWIHLDYIRYPCEPTEDFFSFDAETRARFKAYSGVDIATVRSMNSGNILWNEWIGWNGEQVTQFLRELRLALGNAGRKVKLSAAVFPDAENARALIGQEWELWAREGLVEMLCPMLYTDNSSFFEKYARKAAAIAAGRCMLAVGIGIATADGRNGPEEVVTQLKTARSLGADGAVLFSSGSLTPEYFAALAKMISP